MSTSTCRRETDQIDDDSAICDEHCLALQTKALRDSVEILSTNNRYKHIFYLNCCYKNSLKVEVNGLEFIPNANQQLLTKLLKLKQRDE